MDERRSFLVPPPEFDDYGALNAYRQLRNRREGQGGTREYIRFLILLKDHPLPAVTAAVEQIRSSSRC